MAFGSQGNENINIVISAVNRASKVLSDVEKDIGKSAKKMEQLGKSMTLFLTAPLAAGAVGFTKAASDLEESINAVNVVFGEGAKTIHEFGKNSAQAAGISTSAFNQLSAQIGALLLDTGMPLDQIAQKTNQLTVAAADAASVMNKDVSEALFAFGSAIRGETEPIRAFTGDVTDATLQQYALSKGIDTSVTSMTEQQKRILRLEVVFKQMDKFAGDFANTSDSMANSTRITTAEFVNMSARLGKELMPIATSFVTAAGDLIERLNGMSDSTKKSIVVFSVFLGTLGPSLWVFGKLATAVLAVNRALVAYRTGAILARGATIALLGPVGLAVTAATALAAVVGFKLYDSNKKASQSTNDLNAEVDALLAGLNESDPALLNMIDGLQGVGDEASETVKKLQGVRDELSNLLKRFSSDEQSHNRSVAEAIIDQEEKVSDMKQELRGLEKQRKKSDDSEERRRLSDQISEIEEQLNREKDALRSAASFKIALAEEIQEAQRRASLTEFERTMEDLLQRRVAYLTEHLETLKRITAERDAAIQKDKAIQASFLDAQANIQEGARETTKTLASEWEAQMENAWSAANSINEAFGHKTSTPSMPKLKISASGGSWEHGGIVDAPVGTPVPIIAHGQERIIPASQAHSQGGGSLYVVNINNPSVRSQDDIRQFKKQVEDSLRDVIRNRKLQTV